MQGRGQRIVVATVQLIKCNLDRCYAENATPKNCWELGSVCSRRTQGRRLRVAMATVYCSLDMVETETLKNCRVS